LAFLPEPLIGPNDYFEPPEGFLWNLQTVFDSNVPTPMAPPVHFNVLQNTLQFNSELLQDYNIDFKEFLLGQT
jgi:hypothetical protein